MTLEVLALLLVLAWLPVFKHFAFNWKSRKNPESLAIITLILFASYVATVPSWVRLGIAQNVVLYTIIVLDLAVCGHFYLAFRWAKKRFHGPQRRAVPND